jgi:acyl carrier protein
MATVFQRVQQIVVELIGVNEAQVEPTTSFKDLNVDSLDLVEIVIRFEEEFAGETAGGEEFEITDDQLKQIATVGDAVEYLKSRGIQDR